MNAHPFSGREAHTDVPLCSVILDLHHGCGFRWWSGHRCGQQDDDGVLYRAFRIFSLDMSWLLMARLTSAVWLLHFATRFLLLGPIRSGNAGQQGDGQVDAHPRPGLLLSKWKCRRHSGKTSLSFHLAVIPPERSDPNFLTLLRPSPIWCTTTARCMLPPTVNALPCTPSPRSSRLYVTTTRTS